MKKIVTVTLNPSLDETLITSHLNFGYLNHVVDSRHLDASGGGVNVSRALTRLETPTHALIVLGNDTFSYAYKGLIDQEPFATTIIRYPGPTRSDTIIVDRGEKTETHIMDEDSVGPRDNIPALIEALLTIIDTDDVVVCAGNLPHGTPADVYAQITRAAHGAGASVIIMTHGEALKQALTATPDMVVLTQLEAEALFNFPVRTLPDLRYSAKKLLERGCHQVLMVMSDFSGALLAEDDSFWLVEITELDASGTGSGVIDALLAGYLAGWFKDTGTNIALQQGAAAMLYTAARIGNEFGGLSQIEVLREKVIVHLLAATDQVSSSVS